MTEVPAQIRRLASDRDDARAAKDFARADELRDTIARAGFVVRDTPTGTVLELSPRFEPVDPGSITSSFEEPATLEWSVHLLYEGSIDDLVRFVEGLGAHDDVGRTEIVVVDPASEDGDAIEDAVGARARVLHLTSSGGWAADRNAGLKTSSGALVLLADLSIEPTGSILPPLARAFEDPGVAIAGPFGVVTEDMREWREARGPDADAVEGYAMAFRRDALRDGLIDERYRWYRNADLDLSLQLRREGGRAVVVELPVAKHLHRGWDALDDDERAARSRRNYHVFLERWRDRRDLLLAGRGGR